MSPGKWLAVGSAVAAAVFVAVRHARRGGPPAGRGPAPAVGSSGAGAEYPLEDDPLAVTDNANTDISVTAEDLLAAARPAPQDGGDHGFFIQGDAVLEADGTWLHTRTLRIAQGLGVPSLSLELIAPTLRRAELRRGDVIVDGATAHGGVLTLQARDVSGRLVVRVHTTDADEPVRGYWRHG
jgi:hypothetical protein